MEVQEMETLTKLEWDILKSSDERESSLDQIVQSMEENPNSLGGSNVAQSVESLVERGFVMARRGETYYREFELSDPGSMSGLRFQLSSRGKAYLDALALNQRQGPTAAPLKPPPGRIYLGMWKDLGLNISDEEIAEARREMWGNSPRDFPE
jgi:hypothetical protein